MVQKKSGTRERDDHNTNFRDFGHFLTIFPGKTVRSIFMKFSEFVYHVKDYSCTNFRDQQK